MPNKCTKITSTILPVFTNRGVVTLIIYNRELLSKKVNTISPRLFLLPKPPDVKHPKPL
jgi:hypothetical protein